MSLSQKALNGVKWNLLTTLVITFLSSILLWILSHILTVSQYGIISASIIVTNFCNMILDFGVSNSIIRSKELNSSELPPLQGINFVTGVAVSLSVYFFSDYISNLFHAGHGFVEQVRYISIGLLIISFGVQPKALLTRAMRFDILSIVSLVLTTTNFIIAIFFAYYFKTVWCVAIAYIVSNFASLITLVYFCRKVLNYRYSISFRFSKVKNHLLYGVQLVFDSIINQISINTYPVMMSRIISISAIGGYNLSYSLSISLFEKLNPVLSHSLFPALSKINNDGARLRKAFLKVCTYSSLINFPILVGMYFISSDVVDLFFGTKWDFIKPIIKILCLTGVIRSLDTPIISILLVRGEMYRNVYLGIFKLIIGLLLAYYLGVNFGLTGICISFFIVQFFNTFISYFVMVRPLLKIRPFDYLFAVFIPLFHTSIMSLFLFYYIDFFKEPSLFSMLSAVFLGCVVYVFSIFLSPFEAVKEFRVIVMGNILSKVGK